MELLKFANPLPPTHPTVAAALRDIVAGSSPRVFGFGERHPFWGKHLRIKTPERRFLSEIMPVLARKHGIKYFGIETLPETYNDDYQAYFKSGGRGPLPHRISEDLKEMGASKSFERVVVSHLRSAARGYQATEEMVIIGGLMCDMDILFLQSEGTLGVGSHAIQEINLAALRLVDRALVEGAAVALYSGAAHTSISPVDEKSSYVEGVRERLGSLDEYREVRLIVPEYILVDSVRCEDEVIGLSQRAPLRGVYLTQDGAQSFTICFPRSRKCRLFT